MRGAYPDGRRLSAAARVARTRETGTANRMGLRIYNLFPTLAGPVAAWTAHLDRIAAMRFDWVYVNPFHATGGSRSLYAVADYFRLNPDLRGDDARDDDEIVASFARDAEARGLGVMMDLVVNHTANDASLVREHPEWYARDERGEIAAPFAVDPDDPTKRTVWGDLAELDYSDRPERAALVAYVRDVAVHYARLGIRGFRCDAAYKVPAAAWAEIGAAVRTVLPNAVLAAETLGCTPAEIAKLRGAGFDAFFNSSKWWDFSSPWLLEQYERVRHIAPTIAFPESHDTPRLASELDPAVVDVAAEYRFRYLFAATFSSGVLMPMGYEFGLTKPLDVVATTPSDWNETPRFDISAFVAATNDMKAEVPALHEEGAIAVASEAAAGRPLVLVRDGGATDGDVVVVVNARAEPARLAVRDALRTLGDGAREVTPERAPAPTRNGAVLELAPHEIRIFAGAPKTAAAANASEKSNGSERRKAGKAGAEAKAAAMRDVRLEARPVRIERVRPQLDEGRFPIKRVVGESIDVTANVFRDGHDLIDATILYRERGGAWREAPFVEIENDEWAGSFRVDRNATYEYTIEAWPDLYGTWHHDTEKKRDAGASLAVEVREGRALVDAAIARSDGAARTSLEALARALDGASSDDARVRAMLADETLALLRGVPDRALATRYAPTLAATVDRRAAAFAAWYELFPRSQGTTPGVHGTFADAAKRLPDIRAMGFDVVYLPPIHPIGHAFRKGKNNTLDVGPNDPGSPWAIGNENGGHTSVEPALGTIDDFDAFVAAARANGLEVALDYALQCSPDHPYVAAHREWFTIRPDGTIKYAENPPKKYQDIVNFDWFGPHAPALWDELRDVVEFWIGHGVTTFRVDNPHTKPFAFWEWMIADVRSRHPETIFLAEAFTRPKVAYELAKGGFSQNYTYFTWRNTKTELTAYLTEIVDPDVSDFFRPNFFANTPDILPPYLQTGGRPAFRIRLALAATLSSLYGIYSGYELCENAALPGREEYLDSEKYEIRVRDYDAPGNIKAEIAKINRIRRENDALHDWKNLTFYRADDDAVLFYGKRTGTNVILVAVNLDPFAVRETTLWFPTGDYGLADDESFGVEELLRGTPQERWRGSPHGVRLDPNVNPATIFRLTLPERPATA